MNSVYNLTYGWLVTVCSLLECLDLYFKECEVVTVSKLEASFCVIKLVKQCCCCYCFKACYSAILFCCNMYFIFLSSSACALK
jgi:hypothetical protein